MFDFRFGPVCALSAALLSSVAVLAQDTPASNDFDQWLKQEQQGFNDFSQQSAQNYQGFVDAADAEFVRWLGQAWQEYRQVAARVRDPAPKPAEQPAAQSAPEITAAAKPAPAVAALARQPVAVTPPSPVDAKALPANAKALPANTKALPVNAISISFYGHALALSRWPIILPVMTDLTPPTIASAWAAMAKSAYPPVLANVKQACKQAACGDWALLQLVRNYAAKLAPQDPQQQTFMAWFLADKLGLSVRGGVHIAHMGAAPRLILLYHPVQQVFAEPFYRVAGDDYYPLVERGTGTGSLLTYPGGFNPPATYHRRPVDLAFTHSLAPAGSSAVRALQWREGAQTQQLALAYSAERAHFFNSYPQIELVHYFNAPLAPDLVRSAQSALAPHLQNKSPLQQAATLLALVQGLPYLTDEQQFGRENYLMPEQLLAFPAADCEDRSFFYAALVKSLLRAQVLGVRYPGHVATALSTAALGLDSESLDGSTQFSHNQAHYLLADPTYLGAGLGQQMSRYAAGTGQLIIK
ncbi:hypothetical protein [Simiduia aestuariiviva]|uniref:DUF4056 domain-containing protein n=1 Tax=Simiduia aestuariiviva TaxID=1510459 RepID=A0A839UIW9_9GAMM|nr:hypothetical protein [Simiduia aestuariiviva]MBB3168034.1 hypothetical protein [Simiduia aestuariiviva]